ncbi:DUF742 domain-containing protein [Streptomyces sp. NPDC018045]|uniref:DUF742 domain-containing protein n=1 Tax=Streptomyces sp. NPDC018045 TaxID=3365037 RepID=UPI00379FD047
MNGPPPRRTRTYALTENRAARAHGHAAQPLTMQSLICTADRPGALVGAVPQEWQTVLAWCCGTGIAVAEIAARLQLRLTPTLALLRAMHAHGLITSQTSLDADGNVAILLRVRNCLARTQ